MTIVALAKYSPVVLLSVDGTGRDGIIEGVNGTGRYGGRGSVDGA